MSHLIATLRAATASTISVDEAAGVIRNVAVCTIGPASGHGFNIDRTTLELLKNQIGELGVKSRVKHPKVGDDGTISDAMFQLVGVLTNPRIEGDSLRGDVRIEDFAAAVPGLGDVRSWLLGVAKSQPEFIGMSAVFTYKLEARDGQPPVARPINTLAVDFVETPAANPNGLLSALPVSADTQTNPPAAVAGTPPETVAGSTQEPLRSNPAGTAALAASPAHPKGGPFMDPKIKEALVAMGLNPAASEEQAKQFYDALGDVAKAKLSSPTAAPAEPATEGRLSARHTDDVVALESKRVEKIAQLAKLYGVSDKVKAKAIADGLTPEQAAPVMLRAVEVEPVKQTPGTVDVGEDLNIASLSSAVGDALSIRAGVKVEKPHDRSREFAGRSFRGVARAYLDAIGVKTATLSDDACAKLVFNRSKLAALSGIAMLQHSPGDFSNILADTVNKSLRRAYDETPTTWNRWARRTTASDFKTITSTQLSEAPSLLAVRAGEEYKDGRLLDSKETYVLQKYGRILTLNWETVINDDLGAFNRVPTAMGQAARRLEDDVVYFHLLQNAAMADTGNLFNTTALTTAGGHANQAASGTVINIANLNTALAAMAAQTGLNGAVLNVRPRFLLTSPAIKATAWEVLNSTASNESNKNANVRNPFGPGAPDNLELIVEPRISAGVTLNAGQPGATTASGSATRWYLAADTGLLDTVEVCFLESEPAPVVEEEDGFRIDGRSFKIRHTVAAKAVDYRGLYLNPGA